MIKYFFRKKKAEWKVKALLYETLGSLLDNQKDLMDFIRKISSAEATGATTDNTTENAAGHMAKNTTKI